MIAIDDIGFASFDACCQNADPKVAGAHHADHLLILRRNQLPFFIILNRAHEVVSDDDSVVQVLCLAVGIPTGRAANFDEFFDFGVPDRQINGRRAPTQGALADRQRQGIHDADEGHDAGCLTIAADGFTDRA